jgi:ABC-type antimicrobial peptide transport system permease subunit
MRRQGLDVAVIPQVFWPLAQQASRNEILLVRSSGDPMRLVESVRAAIAAIDPRVAVYGIATLEQQIARRQQDRELQTSLLTLFSILALLLAAVGIYGLLHYSVTSMTHELALRMALGADGGRLRRAVIGEGAKVVAAGIAIGLLGAAWSSELLASYLFGVAAFDAATFLLVVGVLGTVAACACYLPSRRAIRVDPAALLR